MNTLDELALKVAKDMYRLSAPAYQHEIFEFAHRLVAELAKQEPVAEIALGTMGATVSLAKLLALPTGTKLYAAPVIPAGTSAWCLGYKEVPK